MTRQDGVIVTATALAVIAALSVAAQTPSFRARVDMVRVDVLVTDDGRPVRGLSASDFEVADNGVRQTVTLVSVEELPVNVVLALDLSDSVDGQRLDDLRTAGRALVASLRPDDRAGLVTFNHAVERRQDLTSSANRLHEALSLPTAAGSTSLLDAVHLGVTAAATSDERLLLIVFSDGVDTASWLTERQVVESVRRSPVVLYAIAVGQRQSRSRFLGDAAEAGGGRLIDVDTSRNLGDQIVRLLAEFRQRYLLSYAPVGVAAAGWHDLDVRVRRRGVEVRARRGYGR